MSIVWKKVPQEAIILSIGYNFRSVNQQDGPSSTKPGSPNPLMWDDGTKLAVSLGHNSESLTNIPQQRCLRNPWEKVTPEVTEEELMYNSDGVHHKPLIIQKASQWTSQGSEQFHFLESSSV